MPVLHTPLPKFGVVIPHNKVKDGDKEYKQDGEHKQDQEHEHDGEYE